MTIYENPVDNNSHSMQNFESLNLNRLYYSD